MLRVPYSSCICKKARGGLLTGLMRSTVSGREEPAAKTRQLCVWLLPVNPGRDFSARIDFNEGVTDEIRSFLLQKDFILCRVLGVG